MYVPFISFVMIPSKQSYTTVYTIPVRYRLLQRLLAREARNTRSAILKLLIQKLFITTECRNPYMEVTLPLGQINKSKKKNIYFN